MSDNGRQSFTDKISAAFKPDSQKTTTEHLGDKFSGKVDNAASSMQPQGHKSLTQKVGDALTGHGGSNHNATNNHSSLTDKKTVL